MSVSKLDNLFMINFDEARNIVTITMNRDRFRNGYMNIFRIRQYLNVLLNVQDIHAIGGNIIDENLTCINIYLKNKKLKKKTIDTVIGILTYIHKLVENKKWIYPKKIYE